MKNFVKKYALAFAIIVTAVLALVLRLIMVGDIPRGWNVDEAGIAYDAWCIAKYGVDRFRYPYPVIWRRRSEQPVHLHDGTSLQVF